MTKLIAGYLNTPETPTLPALVDAHVPRVREKLELLDQDSVRIVYSEGPFSSRTCSVEQALETLMHNVRMEDVPYTRLIVRATPSPLLGTQRWDLRLDRKGDKTGHVKLEPEYADLPWEDKRGLLFRYELRHESSDLPVLSTGTTLRDTPGLMAQLHEVLDTTEESIFDVTSADSPKYHDLHLQSVLNLLEGGAAEMRLTRLDVRRRGFWSPRFEFTLYDHEGEPTSQATVKRTWPLAQMPSPYGISLFD